MTSCLVAIHPAGDADKQKGALIHRPILNAISSPCQHQKHQSSIRRNLDDLPGLEYLDTSGQDVSTALNCACIFVSGEAMRYCFAATLVPD